MLWNPALNRLIKSLTFWIIVPRGQWEIFSSFSLDLFGNRNSPSEHFSGGGHNSKAENRSESRKGDERRSVSRGEPKGEYKKCIGCFQEFCVQMRKNMGEMNLNYSKKYTFDDNYHTIQIP